MFPLHIDYSILYFYIKNKKDMQWQILKMEP